MKIKQFEWWIVAFLGFSAFFLGMFGYEALFLRAEMQRNLLDLIFHSVKLFTGEFVGDFASPLPWQLEIARWLAPAISLYAAFKALLYLLRREFMAQFLRFYSGHIIVGSLNDKSRYLIRDLLRKGKKVIVLADLPDSRNLDEIERLGAIIQSGDLDDPKFLKRIAVHKARYVVLLHDDDESNISQAILLYQYLNSRPPSSRGSGPQVIHTHVADDIKLGELNELSFFEELQKNSPQKANCEIRIFSMYERTARVLFNQYAPDIFEPVGPDSPQTAVAILGSGALAQSMVIRLAHLAHFANFKKVKVTLFHDSFSTVEKLIQNFPGLDSILELEPVEHPLELFEIETFSTLHKKNPFSAVYLLCENDSLSANLLKKLSHIPSPTPLPIVLGLKDPEGILSKWYNAQLLDNLKLYKFNLIAETFSEEALISESLDELARIIHKTYLSGLKHRDPTKATHKDWHYLPPGARDQNRDQADHIFVKLRAMNCIAVKGGPDRELFSFEEDPELVELLSKMEHNRWWAQKLLSGWTYGESEDGKLKHHPDLVPYEQLDEPTKDWDRAAVKNIPILLAKNGLRIQHGSA